MSQRTRRSVLREPQASFPWAVFEARGDDRTGQHQARLERLLSLTAALSGAVTRAEIIDEMFRLGCGALDARGMGLHIEEGSRVATHISHPRGDELQQSLAEEDAGDRILALVSKGEPVWMHDPAEMGARDPLLARLAASVGDQALYLVPAKVRDRVLASVSISFEQPRPDDAGEHAFVLAVAQQCALALDRARLYEREHALRAETERLFESVIRDIPALVIVVRGRRLQSANTAVCTALGRTEDGLVGRDLLSLIHPDDEARARALVEEIERTHVVPGPFECRFPRPDGKVACCALSGISVINSHGGAATMVVGADVTERRRMEAQLLFADRMSSMGTLAAGVAHEINNPLSFIVGSLELLDRDLPRLHEGDGASAERIRDMLGQAREAAERVRIIVRDLKTFSRGDEESIGVIDLRRVIDASISMVANEIRHRARLVRDFRGLAPVRGNEARLGQVFLNLLTNAVHAVPEGRAADHEIRIVGRRDEQHVVVDVSDTGHGIAPELLDRIFEPFFTTKPVGVGTGLGLSICHSIIKDMGGEISVDSEPDNGATFRVVLPRVDTGVGEPAPVSAAAATPRATAPLRRARIAVIDDEPLLCEIMVDSLPAHDVVAETHARRFVQRIAAGERFDVIFCDLMMPEMTGAEVFEELLRIAPEQADAVVFMTGGAFTPRTREFLSRSRALRLEKPFDLPTLLSVVEQRLSPGRAIPHATRT